MKLSVFLDFGFYDFGNLADRYYKNSQTGEFEPFLLDFLKNMVCGNVIYARPKRGAAEEDGQQYDGCVKLLAPGNQKNWAQSFEAYVTYDESAKDRKLKDMFQNAPKNGVMLKIEKVTPYLVTPKVDFHFRERDYGVYSYHQGDILSARICLAITCSYTSKPADERVLDRRLAVVNKSSFNWDVLDNFKELVNLYYEKQLAVLEEAITYGKHFWMFKSPGATRAHAAFLYVNALNVNGVTFVEESQMIQLKERYNMPVSTTQAVAWNERNYDDDYEDDYAFLYCDDDKELKRSDCYESYKLPEVKRKNGTKYTVVVDYFAAMGGFFSLDEEMALQLSPEEAACFWNSKKGNYILLSPSTVSEYFNRMFDDYELVGEWMDERNSYALEERRLGGGASMLELFKIVFLYQLGMASCQSAREVQPDLTVKEPLATWFAGITLDEFERDFVKELMRDHCNKPDMEILFADREYIGKHGAINYENALHDLLWKVTLLSDCEYFSNL